MLFPRRQWILLVLLGFVAFFSVFARGFLSTSNLTATAVYATEPLILALGQTLVIISGGIDISVGSALALSGVVGALLMRSLWQLTHAANFAIGAGVIAGLGAGTAVGGINGLLVARLGIPPFVVTLGMLGIARGLVFVLTRGTSVSELPHVFLGLADWNLFGAPLAIVVALILGIIVAWILRRTLLGRYIFAIGGNEQATVRAGVNVSRVKVIVYMISGVLAAITGLLVLIRFSTASPLAGVNRELDSIAAAVIGGASLSGGKGSVLGSVVGALIVSVLLIGLVIMNVDPYWQMVSVGTLVILAVTIDRIGEGIER
jgi:ribose transport system permease protein